MYVGNDASKLTINIILGWKLTFEVLRSSLPTGQAGVLPVVEYRVTGKEADKDLLMHIRPRIDVDGTSRGMVCQS